MAEEAKQQRPRREKKKPEEGAGATGTKERPETATGAKKDDKKAGNEAKKNDRKRKDGRQKKEKQAKVDLNLNAPTFVPNFGPVSGVPTGLA